MARTGWAKLLDLLGRVGLDSWDSALDSGPMPSPISFSAVACRHAFDDLSRFIAQMPEPVSVWDLKRHVADLPAHSMTGVASFLGDDFDMIDLSIDSRVSRLEALAYWTAYMAKHGQMAKFFRRGLFEEHELSNIVDSISSLLAATPLLFHRENALKYAHHWANKSSLVMTAFASLA